MTEIANGWRMFWAPLLAGTLEGYLTWMGIWLGAGVLFIPGSFIVGLVRVALR